MKLADDPVRPRLVFQKLGIDGAAGQVVGDGDVRNTDEGAGDQPGQTSPIVDHHHETAQKHRFDGDRSADARHSLGDGHQSPSLSLPALKSPYALFQLPPQGLGKARRHGKHGKQPLRPEKLRRFHQLRQVILDVVAAAARHQRDNALSFITAGQFVRRGVSLERRDERMGFPAGSNAPRGQKIVLERKKGQTEVEVLPKQLRSPAAPGPDRRGDQKHGQPPVTFFPKPRHEGKVEIGTVDHHHHGGLTPQDLVHDPVAQPQKTRNGRKNLHDAHELQLLVAPGGLPSGVSAARPHHAPDFSLFPAFSGKKGFFKKGVFFQKLLNQVGGVKVPADLAAAHEH